MALNLKNSRSVSTTFYAPSLSLSLWDFNNLLAPLIVWSLIVWEANELLTSLQANPFTCNIIIIFHFDSPWQYSYCFCHFSLTLLSMDNNNFSNVWMQSFTENNLYPNCTSLDLYCKLCTWYTGDSNHSRFGGGSWAVGIVLLDDPHTLSIPNNCTELSPASTPNCHNWRLLAGHTVCPHTESLPRQLEAW